MQNPVGARGLLGTLERTISARRTSQPHCQVRVTMVRDSSSDGCVMGTRGRTRRWIAQGCGAPCPPEKLVSGVCNARWYGDLEYAVILGWAALAGALAVAVSAVVAPSHRGAVATVAFLAVLAMFLPLAYALGWRPSVGAIFTGAVSWVWVLWWERKKVRSNTAAESDANVPALRASARAPHRER